MREHLVQPLKWTMQMHFDPARRARHVLPMVLGTPAFDKTHSNCAHFRQLIYRLKTVIDTRGKQLRKFGIIEYPQRASSRYFAYSRRVEAVVVIAVTRLHKDRTVRQTLGVHLAIHIVQMYTLADMTSCVLYGRVAVDVAKLAKTKTIVVATRVGKTVNNDRR